MSDLLRTNNDYACALLMLMSDLNSATKAEAIDALEKNNGHRILPEHWEIYQSRGEIIWQNWIAWARARLVKAGLMGKGGYGIWTITDAGHEWIREHPAENNKNIKELFILMKEEKLVSPTNKNDIENKPDFFILNWKNNMYPVFMDHFVKNVEQAIKDDPPEEAFRYKNWYIHIAGCDVSPKWLFHLITGAEYSEFTSHIARKKLNQVGLEALSLDNKMNSEGDSSIRSGLFPRMDKDARDAYLLRMSELLIEILPHKFGHVIPKHRSGTNYIQFDFTEFPSSHYEFTLARKVLKFGFHFESSQENNLSRLSWIEPHLAEINQDIGREVSAKRWGKNWAYIQLEISYAGFSGMMISMALSECNSLRLIREDYWFGSTIIKLLSEKPEYANVKVNDLIIVSSIMARFIDATYDQINKAFQTFPGGKRRRRSNAGGKRTDKKSEIYRRIDEQIDKIQMFLAGRLSNRPSDELLCDWVQFSYLSGLYEEGMALFEYINAKELDNDWLYKRTKKYAQVCRFNAKT